LKELVK